LHGDTQFAGGGDTKEIFQGVEYIVESGNGIYNFKTSVKKMEHIINVYALNTQSMQYTNEVLADKVTSNSIFDEVQVDMRRISSGKYRVQVGNDVKFIYLNTENNYSGMPMFVDVFHLPDSNPQSFVDAALKPKRTKYTIAFSARRVLWQYKTRTGVINNIEDTTGDFAFKSNGLRKFISNRPIPFSDVARKTLVAKSGTLNITSPLPNPQADKLLDKQNELFTTESFINF